jgi:hypothetical protein
MKTQILFPIIFALLLIGCKKETPPPTPTVPIAEETVPQDNDIKTECYLYNEFGSVISLEIDYPENTVSGRMTYALKEKDSNYGVFTGKIENNVLIADYSFVSEGVESKRQIAFQIKDGELFEGYGEMNEDGTRFKDVTKLKFNYTMPLKKVECSK